MSCMSREELADLTGYKTAKRQITWLRQRGWRFELDRLDRPKVDVDYYRSRMGLEKSAPAMATGPNWAAI